MSVRGAESAGRLSRGSFSCSGPARNFFGAEADTRLLQTKTFGGRRSSDSMVPKDVNPYDTPSDAKPAGRARVVPSTKLLSCSEWSTASLSVLLLTFAIVHRGMSGTEAYSTSWVIHVEAYTAMVLLACLLPLMCVRGVVALLHHSWRVTVARVIVLVVATLLMYLSFWIDSELFLSSSREPAGVVFDFASRRSRDVLFLAEL